MSEINRRGIEGLLIGASMVVWTMNLSYLIARAIA